MITPSSELEIRRNVGHRLRERRAILGYTQEQMANVLGITAARYSKYEIGRSEAPYSVLIKIAKLTEITLDYLIAGQEYPREARAQPRARQLLEFLHLLPIPAVIYDKFNRLFGHNRQYLDTLFSKCSHVLQAGTHQEVVLRAWAYSQGHGPLETEEFVRKRVNHDPNATPPIDVRIGSQRLQIAESHYSDCRLVLVTGMEKVEEDS